MQFVCSSGGQQNQEANHWEDSEALQQKKKETATTASKPPPDDPKPPPGGAKAKAKPKAKTIKDTSILKKKPGKAVMPEVVIDTGARSSKGPELPVRTVRTVPVKTEHKRTRKAAPPEQEKRRSKRKMVTVGYSIA